MAKVLLKTPIQNASPTPSLPPARSPSNRQLFKRSNTPYVIAGFTVSTKPGLRPVQSAVTPPSAMISFAVSQKLGSLAGLADWAGGTQSCWRVAMTAAGMVNIWARAPAAAPRDSSAGVDKELWPERRVWRVM